MFDQNGQLHYVGDAGSGLKARDLKALMQKPLPFVVEVEFAGMSHQGKLRFPVFKHLRDDLSETDPNSAHISQFIGVPVVT